MAAPTAGIIGEAPAAPSVGVSGPGSGADAPGAPPIAGADRIGGTVDGAAGRGAVYTSPGDAPAPVTDPSPTGGAGLGDSSGQGASIQNETPLPNQGSAESPPIRTGMTPPPPQNQVRRFSKSNPANVEVFRRDSQPVETFDKPQPGADATPHVAPPRKSKKGKEDSQ